MDVDSALRRLGKYGRWQIILYIVISVFDTFPAAWHMLAIVFVGSFPSHGCTLPDGVTNRTTSYPHDEKLGGPSECSIYKHVYSNSSDDESDSNATQKCTAWDYWSDDNVGPTIVSEWDLVCERRFMKDMTQTIMVVGVMFGAMLFTILSDNFGRKPVFLFSHLAMVVVGVITAFVNSYYAFCVFRFFAGALQQGIILTGFVMACELFPAKYRTFAGMAIENFWATGMCILALWAYLVRHWRYLQLLISLLGLFAIPLIWFLPESIPWLCANNRIEDAEEIIQKAAKFNKVSMPNRILLPPEEEAILSDNKEDPNGEIAQQNGKKSKAKFPSSIIARFRKNQKRQGSSDAARYTLLDVLRNRRLLSYAAMMCFIWMVNNLVYYGLSFSTATLAGDRYLNFFFSGLVEIPAYTSCIFILERFGRRWPLCIFHFIAGVSLAATMFIPKETAGGTDLTWLSVTFYMIGKFGITGTYGIIFLYTPEIFPTTLRAQAMGIASLGGRIGNMMAPFADFLASAVPWLPGILFGALSLAAGLLVFFLPETLNRPLPQTIEDIENWTKKPPPRSHEGTKPMELQNDTKC